MRVSQLESREPFAEILAETLSRAFSEWLDRPVEVECSPGAAGQLWLLQPLLGAFYVPGAGAAARRYLADAFRHTGEAWRMAPQWTLGTTLATSPGLRLFGRPAFRARPAVPDAGHLLVLPGNRRLRLLDFGRGTSRVVPKAGFGASAIETEIAVRGRGEDGPFPPILRYAADCSWFEEAIFDGYSLARCPAWLPRRRLEALALSVLERWVSERAARRDPDEVVGQLAERLQQALGRAEARFGAAAGGLSEAVERLAALARRLPAVETGPSHGDCQPGNVLVSRRGEAVTFVDWEHHAERTSLYDRLVFALRARSPRGLCGRVRSFARGARTSPLLSGLPAGSAWRRPAAALFLLEELDWSLAAASAPPIVSAPEGTRLVTEAVRLLGRPGGME